MGALTSVEPAFVSMGKLVTLHDLIFLFSNEDDKASVGYHDAVARQSLEASSSGAVDIAQLVKCLLRNMKDLTLIPRIHKKIPAVLS